jgi:hypothetical protein
LTNPTLCSTGTIIRPTTNASFGAKGALTAFLYARAAMLNKALSDLAADVHGRIERRHGVLSNEVRIPVQLAQ